MIAATEWARELTVDEEGDVGLNGARTSWVRRYQPICCGLNEGTLICGKKLEITPRDFWRGVGCAFFPRNRSTISFRWTAQFAIVNFWCSCSCARSTGHN